MRVLRVAAGILGSMKLSVVIVVLLGLLTWLGTLAQVDKGLYEVQKDYFESWFVVCELPLSIWSEPLFYDRAGNVFALKIPLPGAYPLLMLLFANLIVGGIIRLRLRWRNSGVLIAHLGIGLLLIAGFVKLHYSVAGHLALYEASGYGVAVGDKQTSSSSFVSFHDYELAVLRADSEAIEERVVGGELIEEARDGGVVELPAAGLPFRVRVSHFVDNARVRPEEAVVHAPAPVVDGVFLQAGPLAKEREHNRPGCYVTVIADDDTRHEGILVCTELRPFTRYRYPFTFEVEGERYGLDLRRVIRELPFEVRLDEFRKTDHPGTLTPKDFRSFVTVRDGEHEQKVQIFMNAPLRKDGFVLFQTNWGPQDMSGPPWYSVFEVAENPSDQWPHIACWIIAAGLLIHFCTKLVLFLLSSTRERLSS